MKALVCISNYGDSQLLYLHQLLISYDNMGRFEMDIVLHTTTRLDLDRYSFQARQILCDPAVGRDLALRHREVMVEAQDRYDVFIYTENDILITEQNLLAFWGVSKRLPDPYVAGLIRFERNRRRLDDPELYLPDAHPAYGPVYQGEVTAGNVRCAMLRNPHQGCYVLTRPQLKRAMKGKFFNYFVPSDRLNLEIGATFVYIGCGLQKVIPIDDIDHLLVHHLPDKYVNLDEPPWNQTPPYTLAELKACFAGAPAQ